MINPVPNSSAYPLPFATEHEEAVLHRKKRSPQTTASAEPDASTANDRARRRTGGGLDSLGRGNVL